MSFSSNLSLGSLLLRVKFPRIYSPYIVRVLGCNFPTRHGDGEGFLCTLEHFLWLSPINDSTVLAPIPTITCWFLFKMREGRDTSLFMVNVSLLAPSFISCVTMGKLFSPLCLLVHQL